MMRPYRITLAGLMILIALTAVGLAALRHPTRFWANATFSMALAVDFAAVVLAVASSGRARASWASFAVCGWGYLILATFPWLEEQVGPQLVTTPWIESAYQWNDPEPSKPLLYAEPHSAERFRKDEGAGWDQPQITAFLDDRPAVNNFVRAAPYSFFRIAHSLFAIACGLAGGLLALGATRRGDDAARSTSITTAHP